MIFSTPIKSLTENTKTDIIKKTKNLHFSRIYLRRTSGISANRTSYISKFELKSWRKNSTKITSSLHQGQNLCKILSLLIALLLEGESGGVGILVFEGGLEEFENSTLERLFFWRKLIWVLSIIEEKDPPERSPFDSGIISLWTRNSKNCTPYVFRHVYTKEEHIWESTFPSLINPIQFNLGSASSMVHENILKNQLWWCQHVFTIFFPAKSLYNTLT